MNKQSDTNSSRKIVVLTPVKNEAWILPLFCQSASIWSDYIVIADQNSTDGSKEIAMKFPKVVVIENNSADLHEDYRNRLLVQKARELVGTNGILFRLDADEILTPNFNSNEWNRIRQSEKGTTWRFRWLQINKKISSYWEMKEWGPIYGAFVDDGRDYTVHGLIHERELFNSDKNYVAKEIGVLHFQFVDWNRMQSKHKWYQCFERIHYPNKSAIDIYRYYHWMCNPKLPYKKIPNEWIDNYKNLYNISIYDYNIDKPYWWDDKINEYFEVYTPQYFSRIETCSLRELPFAKGKTIVDKLLLLYLNITTTSYNQGSSWKYRIVKRMDYILKSRCGMKNNH